MVTQERLKQSLDYDPQTGIFTRRIAAGRWGRIPAGTVAGSPFIGYLQITVDGEQRMAHQYAFLYMTGTIPPEIDHLNRIKNDNRWCNLRAVSHAENMQNTNKRRSNTSGHAGVSWHNSHKYWVAYINTNNKRTVLGCFQRIDDAIAARKAAEITHRKVA